MKDVSGKEEKNNNMLQRKEEKRKTLPEKNTKVHSVKKKENCTTEARRKPI